MPAVSGARHRNIGCARLGRLLREVRKHADFHFLSEENIMEDAGYPGLPQQRHQHTALLSRLDEKTQQVECGSDDFEGITGFLFEWFALHTTTEDRKLGQFLANCPSQIN